MVIEATGTAAPSIHLVWRERVTVIKILNVQLGWCVEKIIASIHKNIMETIGSQAGQRMEII